MVRFYDEETLPLRPPTKREGRPLPRLLSASAYEYSRRDPSILEVILPSANWRHSVVTRIHLSRNGTRV